MISLSNKEQSIPPLRSDLQIYPGPADMDGSPTYSILDPERNAYFKISWAEYSLITRLRKGLTINELHRLVNKETTLRVSLQEIQQFIIELQQKGLLEMQRVGEHVLEESKQRHMHPAKKVLLQYLFFRIPLVNPDRFLARTVHHIRPLLSSTAVSLYCLLILWGFLLIAVRWEDYLSTFTYFFSASGGLAYIAAIIATKLVHELAHAYTAKKYNLHVPTMGVAFLILLPVLYTDATDAWKLSNRRKRMAITAAGVFSEMTIAGIATILWAYLDPGILKSLCFVLGSVNWISTLLININPALRFDGYYLLSDWLGVENLQSRAFQLLRVSSYRSLLGIPLSNPEPKMPARIRRTLIVYAIYTIIYRITLYTAIALLVYFKFTKALGVFLFFVEILVFFIWPVIYEVNMLRSTAAHLRINLRLVSTCLLIGIVFTWWVLPWPHKRAFPSLTVAKETHTLYVPFSGQIASLSAKKGKHVKQKESLAVIHSQLLDSQQQQLELKLEIMNRKLAIIEDDSSLLPFFLEKQAERARAIAELEGVRKQQTQANLQATMDGLLYIWDEELRPGQFVTKDQQLGILTSFGPLDVIAYIHERDIDLFEEGLKVMFRANESRKEYPGQVTRVAPIRARYLEHEALGSIYSGDIPVTQQEKKLLVQGSYYPVRISLEAHSQNLSIGEEGKVLVRGPWHSKFLQLMEWVLSIFWQEGNA